MYFKRTLCSIFIASLTFSPVLSWSNTARSDSNEFLDMDISQLMQVTITSVAKREQNLADAAAAVYVITQDEIHRSGVTTVPEALRLAPGLQVARINSNKWAISSRGINGQFSNKLLVLVDGRTVYTPGFSGTYWETQTTLLEDVDRIEVIRGPGATLWGANAVNGVINIITKHSEDTQGGLVKIGAGNIEEVISGLRYGFELGSKTTGRAYVTYNQRDSFDLLSDGSDANDDWDNITAGFRFDGTLSGDQSWTLQGDIYSNDANQTIEPFFTPTPPFVTRDQSGIDANGGNILGRWEKKLTKGAFKAQAYFDYIDRDESYVGQTYKTTDFEFQYERMLGESHNFTLGLGYRHVDSSFENTFRAQIIPDDRDDDLYSGFIQDEITLLPETLWLTLGTKWENNEFTDNEIQPSGRIMWKPNDTQSIWASISRAVRTPSIAETTTNAVVSILPVPSPFPVFLTINGNPEFDSEEVIAYEAGYRWYPKDNLYFDLALFYNDYEDLFDSQFGTTPQTAGQLEFINNVDGNSYGFELAANWKPEKWLEFVFTYSYLHLDFNESISTNTGFTGQALVLEGSAPEHQVSLRTSLDFLDNWQANLWLRYVSELDLSSQAAAAQGIIVDDYVECDLNISWKPTENLELMAVGQNLLNSDKLEFVSEFFNPPTEVERGFYLKALYRF